MGSPEISLLQDSINRIISVDKCNEISLLYFPPSFTVFLTKTLSNQGPALQYAMSSGYNTKTLSNPGSVQLYATAPRPGFGVDSIDLYRVISGKLPLKAHTPEKVRLHANIYKTFCFKPAWVMFRNSNSYQLSRYDIWRTNNI